jgi:hypothetical protein
MSELDNVLAQLERHHQRATYEAVADYLGKSKQSLMTELTLSRRASWVVAKKSGKPTGYSEFQMHEALETNETVIENSATLVQWMRTHP